MIFVCTMLMTLYLCFTLQQSNIARAKSFSLNQNTLTETLAQRIAISEATQIVTATTVITTNIPVTPSVTEEIIVQSYDFSHVTYNMETSSSIRPSPIDVKQQLGVWVGGGGGRRDLPNNCLAKHPGIVYYNNLVFVEDLMSLSNRTLQPPDPRSQLFENLPDICVCGFEKDAAVNLSLVSPRKDVLLTTQTIAQPVSGINGNFIEGAYCVENNEISTFDFIPGDPFGTYEIVVESNDTIITRSLKLENVSKPYLYYSKRLDGYVLGNFSPNENIRVLFYGLVTEDEPWTLSNDLAVQTDENGIALVLSDNLETPVSIIRGNPTSTFFEKLMFPDFVFTLTGFAVISSEFYWDELRKIHSDLESVANLYYHQGRFPNFIEEADNDTIPLTKDDRLIFLDKAIELKSNHASAYYERGLAYIEDKQKEKALRDFSKAVELSPRLLDAYIARADIYREDQLYAKALKDYDQVIQQEPDNLSHYYSKGYTLIESGDYLTAIKIFSKIIELDPQTPDGYYHKACVESKIEQYTQVTNDLKKAIELDSSYHVQYRGTSQWFTYWGIGGQGYSEIKSCGNIYAFLGSTYAYLGQKTQAMTYIERALKFVDHPIDEMPMQYIPSGEFTMGSLPTDMGVEEIEQPQHSVYLDGYWVDNHEVTRQQYGRCVEAGVCRSIVGSEADGSYHTDNLPMINTTWNDAKTYCEWAGRRLPTEAEWEKAARGKDKRIFPWGNQEPEMCNSGYMPNINYNSDEPRYLYWVEINYACSAPSGAIDMAGNVWEWVADYFDPGYYVVSPYTNPQGPNNGNKRVMRGGSWKTKNPIYLRTANRWGEVETYYSDSVGFRCALSDSRASSTSIMSTTMPLTIPNNSLTDVGINATPDFGSLKFCKESEFNYITGQCTSSQNLISGPVKSVYASWIVPEQYIGSKFKREWYFNGQLFVTGEDSNAYAHVEVEARDSLKEGTYTIKLLVKNKLVQEGTFQIE